jgi:OMF family outer membrane factor
MRWAALTLALLAGAILPSQAQLDSTAEVEKLERSWQQLDRQLRALDALIPKEPEPIPNRFQPAPPLPQSLLQPNAAPSGALGPDASGAPTPLALPEAEELQQQAIQSLSLDQALAIAFTNNPALQAQRERVAAALAELQAAMGTYWPRISAYAEGSTGQNSNNLNVPSGNDSLNSDPVMSKNGLLDSKNQPTDGPFYTPAGGGAYFNGTNNLGEAGLELDYALVDFARTPLVQAARATLEQERNRYGNQLRRLQLDVSEAYYGLQRADQNVRIQDAAVRNDLVILQDTLDMQIAGLVPRLDVMRRRAIEASDQEVLIQAMADRAIARRRLAVVLNLSPEITPTASDPIVPMPDWPLDLEASLRSDAVAAQLLPKLSLFGNAGTYGINEQMYNVIPKNGGCCGTAINSVFNNSGYDWALGLSMQWLLFDAGTTSGRAQALDRLAAASAQDYAAIRNAIRLRLESAFFNHEASLAKLASARRGVAAAIEAFRDVRLRYQTGLSSELDLSITQERLISSLIQRLDAAVDVNITYAQLLRELLPVPRDPNAPFTTQLTYTAR